MNQRSIIGCGNPDRGDDAAGPMVARRLRELGVDALEHSGEGLSLIEAWQGWDDIVLIDAVVTGSPPGTIHDWNGADAPVIEDQHKGSTHAFGVAEGIRLARVLNRLPARLTIYGIEGTCFDFGTPPSTEVQLAIEQLAIRLARS